MARESAVHLMHTRVDPAWVDYNGHMNDAEYARVFSLGVEALMARIGLDESGRERERYTLYTLETHLCYRLGAYEGDRLTVSATLLDHDAKRMHVFFSLLNEAQQVIATSEQMLMGIDSQRGKPAPFPRAVSQQLMALPGCEKADWPEQAGRQIGIPRR
ncbi:thioesterase family protein [Litchfieldella xinjiangensis]|uniref:thioesterase family protein n=1 Tax=Litchfieldella xinjiangensis TaxID=1166948 RepID=UPI0005BDCE11|nr:thioesterase family protein [Halomonas xinjiangensis]